MTALRRRLASPRTLPARAAHADVARPEPIGAARLAYLAALAALLCLAAGLGAAATRGASLIEPGATTTVSAPGRIVPLPASVPHEAGDMVDRRIVPDLIWIARRFPIYVTDGYSGPLPSGRHVGCDECHVHGSDHYNGLAVDLVPLGGSAGCDASWAPITRLAAWAEPIQNAPRPPFRWVGYNGDAGHGCGNHLHLSWNHAAAPMFQLSEWVEVFPAGSGAAAPRRPRKKKAPARTPSGASAPAANGRGAGAGKPRGSNTAASGPVGGVSQSRTGGVSSASGGGPAPGFGD